MDLSLHCSLIFLLSHKFKVIVVFKMLKSTGILVRFKKNPFLYVLVLINPYSKKRGDLIASFL